MCQRGGCSLKGGRHEAGTWVRTLGLKVGGFSGGLTLTGERNEWQRGRLVLKGGGLWDPTLVGEENETLFIRVWKPLPSRCVLKTLRESLKGKAQRGQYLLAVGLGCYKICRGYFDFFPLKCDWYSSSKEIVLLFFSCGFVEVCVFFSLIFLCRLCFSFWIVFKFLDTLLA